MKAVPGVVIQPPGGMLGGCQRTAAVALGLVIVRTAPLRAFTQWLTKKKQALNTTLNMRALLALLCLLSIPITFSLASKCVSENPMRRVRGECAERLLQNVLRL